MSAAQKQQYTAMDWFKTNQVAISVGSWDDEGKFSIVTKQLVLKPEQVEAIKQAAGLGLTVSEFLVEAIKVAVDDVMVDPGGAK